MKSSRSSKLIEHLIGQFCEKHLKASIRLVSFVNGNDQREQFVKTVNIASDALELIYKIGQFDEKHQKGLNLSVFKRCFTQ